MDEAARAGHFAERLGRLGLDPDAANVYVHLCRLGAAKASDLARATRLTRAKSYRVLESLERRGFVSKSLSKPVRFEAADPRLVLDSLQEDLEARRQAFEAAREDLLPSLDRLRGPAEAALAKGRFRLLQGRVEAMRTTARMFEDARAEILVLSTVAQPQEVGRATGIYRVVQAAVARGVKLRVLLADPAPPPADHTAAVGDAVQRRVLADALPMSFVIVDRRQLLMALDLDPTPGLRAEQDVNIWTDARNFINIHLALFERVWPESRPLAARSAEVHA